MQGDLGLDPRKCPNASIISIFDTIQLYPRELYEKGIPLITAATRRVESSVFDPRIKSLNYLNNIIAKQEAIQAGCMEAVLLNAEGYVTECTADNIFIVAGGVLKTPAPHLGILEGITRRTVLELANQAGFPATEAVLTRFDLYTADECFITGSGAELMPVISVDGRTVGDGIPGPVTIRLTEAFRTLIG
jgi:branched-chain amino acid aminotransferase